MLELILRRSLLSCLSSVLFFIRMLDMARFFFFVRVRVFGLFCVAVLPFLAG